MPYRNKPVLSRRLPFPEVLVVPGIFLFQNHKLVGDPPQNLHGFGIDVFFPLSLPFIGYYITFPGTIDR